jgi:hypothetical protein
VDHRRGCRGNASVNIDAVIDDDYKDDGGDGLLALAQPTRRPTP